MQEIYPGLRDARMELSFTFSATVVAADTRDVAVYGGFRPDIVPTLVSGFRRRRETWIVGAIRMA
jgi:hypothetical protein